MRFDMSVVDRSHLALVQGTIHSGTPYVANRWAQDLWLQLRYKLLRVLACHNSMSTFCVVEVLRSSFFKPLFEIFSTSLITSANYKNQTNTPKPIM